MALIMAMPISPPPPSLSGSGALCTRAQFGRQGNEGEVQQGHRAAVEGAEQGLTNAKTKIKYYLTSFVTEMKVLEQEI